MPELLLPAQPPMEPPLPGELPGFPGCPPSGAPDCTAGQQTPLCLSLPAAGVAPNPPARSLPGSPEGCSGAGGGHPEPSQNKPRAPHEQNPRALPNLGWGHLRPLHGGSRSQSGPCMPQRRGWGTQRPGLAFNHSKHDMEGEEILEASINIKSRTLHSVPLMAYK